LASHRSSHPGAVRLLNPYYKVYETIDSYVAVGCLNNRLRKLAAEVMGVDDPRLQGNEFDANALGAERAGELAVLCEDIMRTKTSEEWVALFDAKGVPSSSVKLTVELWDAPQTAANNLIVELDHPVVGKIRMPNSPVRMSGADTGTSRSSPALGQDTRDFLGELGYSAEETAALEAAKVVRSWAAG
jgi:formyl-CoA transferase